MLILSGKRSLIADYRAEHPTQTGVPIAALEHYAHYYPFGMMQPGRNGNRYRFGFQGQEKDDEIYGTGNSMTAEYWQYDARLGRRWNVDPVVKCWESSYATFNNSPILRVDLLGNNAGDYYTKSGQHMGSDGNDDKKGYLVEESDLVYQEDGETIDAEQTENKILFTENHSEFATSSNIIMQESSGDVTESLWIAHATDNESESRSGDVSMYDLLMTTYSFAEDKTELSTNNNSEIANAARAGVIDVLSGGVDPTNGSTHWDGDDFLIWGDAHKKFEQYSSITIDHKHYDIYKNAQINRWGSQVKFGNTVYDIPHKVFRNYEDNWILPPGNRPFDDAGAKFHHETGVENEPALISTGAHGRSIFWRTED